MLKLKTKLFFALGAALVFLFTVSELHATKVELGATIQQNEQLATNLKDLNENHLMIVAQLESEQKLNNQLRLEQELAHQAIELKSQELENALYELNQKDSRVADWSSAHIPDSVISLLEQQRVHYNNRNQNTLRDAGRFIDSRFRISANESENKRPVTSRIAQF